MRRFEWSRVLIVLLVVALLSLGGCGGGGGDNGGGASPAPSPSPIPNPGPSPEPGRYSLEDFKGDWRAEDAAGSLLVDGSEDSVEGEKVYVKILPSSHVALSIRYSFGGEKEYSSSAFSEGRESAENVFFLRFKETEETSGSMTFTVVDSDTLKVVEKGTTWMGGKIRELRYTLRRINSVLPEPNPNPAPTPSPTPGGPVDLSRLDGRWRPYDGSGTFTGSNGEVHEMVLESTSFVLFRYIQQPSPHAGEVMVGQALRWKSRTTASKKGFRIGRIPDTPYKGTKGENGTKIVFGDGNTMEIIDPKNPAYFIVHEKGSLYERGVPYQYDLSYRIEKRM